MTIQQDIAKADSVKRVVRPAPCKSRCPKCGEQDVARQHRSPGDEVEKRWCEQSDCKAKPPWLESNWPYGWKTKKEHINHYCRTCEYEWQTDVLA